MKVTTIIVDGDIAPWAVDCHSRIDESTGDKVDAYQFPMRALADIQIKAEVNLGVLALGVNYPDPSKVYTFVREGQESKAQWNPDRRSWEQ